MIEKTKTECPYLSTHVCEPVSRIYNFTTSRHTLVLDVFCLLLISHFAITISIPFFIVCVGHSSFVILS